MTCLSCLALSLPALAQEGGFDAHGFRLATGDGDPRDPMQFVRAGDIAPRQWSIGSVVEYASRPLLFERDGAREVVLRDLVALDLAAGFAPIDRVRVDLAMPVILTSGGLEGTDGPTPGDLRSSLLVALLEPSGAGGFGLGLLGALDAPTGDAGRWLGSVGPAGVVGLSPTLELDRVTLSAFGGVRLAPSTSEGERPAVTRGGDSAEGSLAIGVLLAENFGLSAEASAAWALDEVVRTAIGVPATAVVSTRYLVDQGGYVMAGIGTGLSQGAGASPIRVVVGGGFAAASGGGPRDEDGDGFDDRTEACPGEPENQNGYRDDDGCPDRLPSVTFVARREGEEEPAAALVLTKPDGSSSPALGRVAVSGLPGETFRVSAKFGACYGGQAEVRLPAEGDSEVEVPIARQDAELVITVTDAAGRPLEGAEARYLLEDEACAPQDRSIVAGKGLHRVGAGPMTVFVTAPGYGVHQAVLTLIPEQRELVDAKLAPTQVALRGGRFQLARPITFDSDRSDLEEASYSLLGQIASLMLSNEGLRFRVRAFAPNNNRRLAQERADSAVAYLTTMGVPGDRLDAVAGGSKPSGEASWVVVEVTDQPE